ncbi:hypothetical protein TNCV_3185331 [Trichonephila clavipes]|nr:hypothetical protein TNCV_3185331 [Trichonephila clavipes]
MFYRIQVWIDPFVPNRDPPDTPQQSELGEGHALSSIRMKSLPIGSIWADIWIKDLIPISKTSCGSSMEHAGQCGHRARSCPNQDSTTSITVSFNSVGLMVSSALFPPRSVDALNHSPL